MFDRRCFLWGAALCGTAVVLGAFAAHALRGSLTAEHLQAFETGVRYQFLHGLGLLLCAVLAAHGARVGAAAALLTAGTLLFSGSLYLLTTVGWRWLGPVTPIGGVLLVLGWIVLLAQNATARTTR